MHNSDSRQWAHETLEIPPDSNPVEMRSRALIELEATDFVPDDNWHDALDVLLETQPQPDCPAPRAYYLERESDLRNAVRQFAESYFDLAPAVRREHWNRLNDPCQTFPPLRRWMQRLAAGLDVEPRFPDSLPESTAIFGNLICREFLQLPGEAGHETRHNLAMLHRDTHRWRDVARDFQRDFPTVARLCPGTIQGFVGHNWRRTADLMINQWAAFTRDLIPDLESPLTAKQMVTVFSAIAVIVFVAVRNSDRKTDPPKLPPFMTPAYKMPDVTNFNPGLTVADFERISKSKPEELTEKERIQKVFIDAGIFKLVRQPRGNADNAEAAADDRPPPPALPEDIEAPETPPPAVPLFPPPD